MLRIRRRELLVTRDGDGVTVSWHGPYLDHPQYPLIAVDSMEDTLFDYSPIVGREPIRWPGGARVATMHGRSGGEFVQMVKDQVDLPVAERARRILGITG